MLVCAAPPDNGGKIFPRNDGVFISYNIMREPFQREIVLALYHEIRVLDIMTASRI